MQKKDWHKFTARLDIEQDVWNWCDASRVKMRKRFDWRENLLNNPNDLKIFDKISKMNGRDAKDYMQKILQKRYRDDSDVISEYESYLRAEFDAKLVEACECIEKTTGKRLIVENFTFLITTFPRCPYNVSQGLMFFNVIPISFHPDVVINFMHEVLHFQTHYYWERNPRSLMSKLSKEEFYFAKESLTVILDNELKPLIKKSDKGYPAHQEFRKLLHKYWIHYHNFDKLVEYAAKNVKKYI